MCDKVRYVDLDWLIDSIYPTIDEQRILITAPYKLPGCIELFLTIEEKKYAMPKSIKKLILKPKEL